ncbi:hypothetical protein BH11MYX1_BH11MYX1_24220 [soil metagenome]
MSAQARHQVVRIASIGEAFAARVQSQPESVALLTGSERVTYAELALRVHGMACALIERGVRAGDRVGLALPRSIDQIAAMLAVFRTGAVLVPIDRAWPTRGDRVIEALESRAGVLPHREPSSLALVLHTSGSTGRPNGVLIEHRALLARLAALAEVMPYDPAELACIRTPATFVDAYAEIFGPLLAGVPAVVLPHPFAIADLVEALDRGVTRLLLVPSLLALLLDARPSLPATLRSIATSGEALPEALVQRVFAASQARLFNIYGSTEVSGDAAIAEILPGHAISIGRALPGVSLRIVEDELQVAGPVLARGYDDRPELTAERFVVEGTTTWFRTRDRARRLVDGSYVIDGRLDDQVKIHGVRVELGEVEAALRAIPGVRDAGAALHAGRIVAAVVADRAIDLAMLVIREAARPSAIAILAELPQTAHGKRDRAALAAQVIAATQRAATEHTPRTAGDAHLDRVVAWFARLTGTAAGPDDELAQLGGDSLARVALLVEIEQAGWHLEHAELPVPLTPVRVAALLRTRGPGVAPEPEHDGAFAVSDFQRVMVLDSLANPKTSIWLEQLSFTVLEPIDPVRFSAAWRAEVAAQPALRLRFITRPEILQIIEPEVELDLTHIPLASLELAAYRVRVRAEEWTRISRVFALGRAPLFDVCVLTGANRSDLVFTYHHAILDGDSARRVVRNVLARYAGEQVAVLGRSFREAVARPVRSEQLERRLAGHVATLPAAPPRTTGMGDLSWRVFHRLLALRTWFARRRVRRHRKLLPAGYTPTVFAGGDLTSQPLPNVLEAALATWARERGVTPIALWATAYALHLARERHTHDVVFGVVVSGRDGRSAATIGMLANCLPLRTVLAPTASLEVTVRAVYAALVELDASARTPLLALGIPPATFLDTLFTSLRFAPATTAMVVESGRGMTMASPHTALVISGSELAIGANQFHRTDRIRRDVLAIVDRLLADPTASIASVLDYASHEGGIGTAQPALS